MWRFAVLLILLVTTSGFGQSVLDPTSFKITIISRGDPIPYKGVYDVPLNGSIVGEIIQAHYFPGLKFYEAGRYKEANGEFEYTTQRPSYLNGNPNKEQYLTTAHYLMGRIYLYHAEGFGRLQLAQQNFEMAIRWNPKNYLARLELARLYVVANFRKEAATILESLIAMNPDEDVLAEAKQDLAKLTGANAPAEAPKVD